MNWILIANTTVPKTGYNLLVLALIGLTFSAIGWRLADVWIKQRRKRKESDS